jgi:hypothetical protein
MAVRPERSGFIRPFGCAWSVIEFLKGSASEGSKRIGPTKGAPVVDILAEYKSALLRAFDRDTVEREEERRIKKGLGASTEEEYAERLEYYYSRIPYKFTRMRYSTFLPGKLRESSTASGMRNCGSGMEEALNAEPDAGHQHHASRHPRSRW